MQSQYIDVSLDPNKIFGVLDDPRQEEDHMGIDFDIEVGATVGKVGAYIFYGAFYTAGYQNYGTGADYYFVKNDWYSISAGAAVSVVLKEIPTGAYYERTAWGSFIGWHSRITGVFWVFEKLGVSGRFQLQQRPEYNIYVPEGNIGLRYKL